MRVGTGAFVLFALVLSACSSPATPSTLPTPTSIPTPSASATPSPTIGVSSSDEQAVLTFISDYMRAAEESIRSPSALAERRSLYSPDCVACAEGAAVAESILNSGLTAEGGQITFTAGISQLSPNSAVVTVVRRLGAFTLRDSSGAAAESIPESDPSTEIYQLSRTADGWIVVAITKLP